MIDNEDLLRIFMATILNFGSLNIDYVYDVDHFVQGGETLSSYVMSTYCGGKGLNQSIALARAGAKVFHAGAVSSNADILIETLNNAAVDTSLIYKIDTPSGHAIIQRDPSGQNCILVYGGANQCITDDHIEQAVALFSAGDYLVLQNEINNISNIIRKAKTIGMNIVLNPSPMDSKIFELPLELVDIFILNEVEANSLCGDTDLTSHSMMQRMIERFPDAAIVLTLGDKGVLYQDPFISAPVHNGIYSVPVVDTTAAGDTFTGFFISSVSQGCTIAKALETASKAAALTVSRKGAEPSIPYLSEVLAAELALVQ